MGDNERKRMPDERPSVTKKLTIHYVNENSQIEWLAENQRSKLLRIREAITRNPTDRETTLASVLAIIDESEVPPIKIEDIDVYIQVGLWPGTDQPGEIFLKADRMGSTISGLLDALSMSVSVSLQAGVPLSWFVDKMKNLQFEPAGPTTDPKIGKATSIVDGIAKWLEYRFPPTVVEETVKRPEEPNPE